MNQVYTVRVGIYSLKYKSLPILRNKYLLKLKSLNFDNLELKYSSG